MIKAKKDFLILLIGKILQVIIALSSIRILTEILSTKEVGNYYLLLGILTFFHFSFLNPLGQYYGRHIIAWKESKNILNATVILLLIRVIISIFSLSIAYLIFKYFGYEQYYKLENFLLFIFIVLVASTFLVLVSAVNTLGHRVEFMQYLLASLILGIFFSLIGVVFFDKSAMIWIYGIAVAQFLLIIPIFKLLVKGNNLSIPRIKNTLNNTYIKKVIYFVLPISIALLLQWGQNISYRFIIETKYSVEVLAFIAIGLSISSAIFSAVEGLATQYYNPLYLQKITGATKQNRAKAWNTLAENMLPIYILLAIFVISLSEHLIHILVATKFHNVTIYVMLGVFIEFFRVTTNIVYLVSQSELKTKSTIFPYAVGCLVALTPMVIFDLSNTLWLIPVCLGISYGVICLLMYRNMKKVLNEIHINITNLFISLIIASPLLLILMLDNRNSIGYSYLIVVFSILYGLGGLYTMFKLKRG